MLFVLRIEPAGMIKINGKTLSVSIRKRNQYTGLFIAKIGWLWFGLMLAVTSIAVAQPICTMKNYSYSDGYTHGPVNDVIQDKKGLIWICTRDGLSYFDGYLFKNIKSYPGDGVAMGSSNIGSIYENSQGDIWCRNQDGRVYLFDVETNKFLDILKFPEEKGLEHSSVNHVITMRKGISWIICKNGTCIRVDDVRCKTGEGIDIYSFPGCNINRIFEDSEGDEWILTDKEVKIIGKKTFDKNLAFLAIFEKNGEIWLTDGKKKLAKYDLKSQKRTDVKLPEKIKDIVWFRMLDQDTLSLGTSSQGLILLNIHDFSFRQINVNGIQGMPNEVFSVYQDRMGDLWLMNRQPGVIHYRKKDGQLIYHQSPVNHKLKHETYNRSLILEDNQDIIWVVPKEGNLCYFDRAEEQLKYYYANPADEQTIISPQIRSYCIDRQGNIWYEDNRSLGKLSMFNSEFRLFPKESGEFEIRSFIFDSQNHLWVGAKNNRLRILSSNYQTLGYLTENGQFSKTPVSFNGNIYCMMLDNRGDIWLGTRLDGLYRFRPRKDTPLTFDVDHFLNDPDDLFSISNNSIYSLFQDHLNRIWVGTYSGGINLIDAETSGPIRFIHHGNRLTNYPPERSNSVRYIYENQDNIILVASTNGLVSFNSEFKNPEDIKFYRNNRRADDPASLNNSDVYYVFSDRQGRTFVLTRNGGINKVLSPDLLSDSLLFDSFTERDGLISDLTLSMIEDRSGGTWLISNQGFSKFFAEERRADHLTGFIFRHGIQFSEARPILSPEGKILMGTDKGILEFDPGKSLLHNFKPSIVFSDLYIQGVKINRPVHTLDKIKLKPTQRNLSIQYAALDYRDSKEIQYAYLMEGIDKEWHYVGHDRSATYINLPHGRYRFNVKSTNSEGIWCDNVKELEVIVTPKFWETIWAWIILILASIILIQVVVYILFTFYKLKYEVKTEKKLTDLKLNFFTEISHELRTPLTLISSPVSDILEHEPLSPVAKEHLNIVKNNTDRMLRMVNQILDFRKIQHKKMNLLVEELDVVAFVSRIMENFQTMAEEKRMAYKLESDREEIFLWVDKDKFEKILFNLLSNAFKYTPSDKEIIVRIACPNEEQVWISVIDKGVGIMSKKIETLFERFESLINRDMLQTSSGIGLSLVRELIELHHGRIDVISQPGEGSEFKVVLNAGLSHFSSDSQVEYILSDSFHDDLPWEEQKTEPDKIAGLDNLSVEKWSILIVEDNKELLRFLKNVLERDYYVIEAVNGEDGLKKAFAENPDIIISDVMMPVMDGLEMVKTMKASQDLCHIPIILLSAKDTVSDRIAGLENGIDDYITKPFHAGYLKTRIRNLIQNRRSLQDFYLNSLSAPRPISISATTEQLMPSKPQIMPYDELFIKQLMAFMEKNIDNNTLTVDDFVIEFSMSRAVFFKKIKSLLGLSPVDFIRNIRIKRAVQLIDSGIDSLSDVAYQCGFNDPNYFAKCFKKQMGMTPSDYKKNKF